MSLHTNLANFHYDRLLATRQVDVRTSWNAVRDEFRADLEAAYWPKNPIVENAVMRGRAFEIAWNIASVRVLDDENIFYVAADTYERLVEIFDPE